MRLPILLALLSYPALAQQLDWPSLNAEGMRHFENLVRIDSTAPPGEQKVAEYVKGVLEAEGIPVTLVAKVPTRTNLIARLKGNGSKKPLLIMGHSDTVRIDPAKWTLPPFSAAHKDGYIYGRGTLDDKTNLYAAMMTILMLKRTGAVMDRDVIFVSEAAEETDSSGINYPVSDHFPEIEAEACLAEGGGIVRRGGQPRWGTVQTSEKLPAQVRLVAKGPSGHGSSPLRGNAIAHLSGAIEKLAYWDPPMELNDTTRTYFEKLATLADPELAAQIRNLFVPEKSAAAREYLAQNKPGMYSMLHTSISPNMIQGGFQFNVIPSEATATLDVRALPDEDLPAFHELMRKAINDPAVTLVPSEPNRPGSAPMSIRNDFFKAIEAAYQKTYGVPTLPAMSNGATDMAMLRAKGVQCYGVGAARDEEDVLKGFGAHSDQERISEDAVYKHLQFFWSAVTAISGARFTK
jgi:acetylornithine deacetylase/succinyl-diaminopimelate desuccinylase-like protein